MKNETEIRIVPLTTEHLSAVMKIERAAFRDPWTATAFHEILGFSDKCWAAFASEELAGYLVTQWVLDEVHILNVAVASGMQRRGVAARLMEFLLSLSRRWGMRDLFLEVRVSNLAAISLYEGLGFHELALRPRYYPDGEDARVMHLHLPETASTKPSGTNERKNGELQG
jgi:ribosomal-protein-alanine N-acetyltransferase